MSSRNSINLRYHQTATVATVLVLSEPQSNQPVVEPNTATNSKVKKIRDTHLSAPASPPKNHHQTRSIQLKQPKPGH